MYSYTYSYDLFSLVLRLSTWHFPYLLLSAGARTIDISCPRSAQQQTRWQPLLLLIDGSDRRTDGRTLERFMLMAVVQSILTVESYTIFICRQSYLLLSGIPSPIHSFIPGLKPSFSANPFHRSPSFFFFRIHYMDSPDCLLLLL